MTDVKMLPLHLERGGAGMITDTADALGYPVDEAMADAASRIAGTTMYSGARGWRPACAVLVAEVQRLRAENHRLMMVCQSAHDRLLRGDEDSEVLALLEDAWTGPAETEANPAREAASAVTRRSLTHDKEPK